MSTKSIIPLIVFNLYISSCGTDDRPKDEAINSEEAEAQPDEESKMLERNTIQPQYSPDKLYKGMSKEEVLDLLGIPVSFYTFPKLTYLYGPDEEFCLKQYTNCKIYFDRTDRLTDFDQIDTEWINILSF